MSRDYFRMARALGHGNTASYVAGNVIVGKYRLERLLGEGGVGAVWLARNLKLDSSVAVKLVRPELNAPDAGERLLKEARAEARLEHRAIVRAFDFGETEHGEPFIVMELLEGRDFGDLLDEENAVDPIRAVRILLPVIAALAYAHDQGVVHRDLKPENVFLAKDGKKTQPKVVDFGIAKLTRFDASTTYTQGGVVLGTPAYMAPEQARGMRDIDHRVDTWALCVVLYEAVTGYRPFGGDNYNAVMRAVIEDQPTPIGVHGVNEPGLWQVIQRGLAKKADDRWQSMKDLGVVLAAWLVSKGCGDDIVGESLEANWLTETDVEALLRPLSEVARVSSMPPAPAQQSSGEPKIPRAATRPRVRLLVMAAVLGIGTAVLLAAASWSEDPPPREELLRLGLRLVPNYLPELRSEEAALRSAVLASESSRPGNQPSAPAPLAPSGTSRGTSPSANAIIRAKPAESTPKPAASAVKPASRPEPAQPSGQADPGTPSSDLKDPY